MSLVTPTTQQVSDNIVAQLQTAISQTVPLLPKSFTRVLAKVLAGVFILIYKYAGFIFLQLFVRYASFDETTINGKIVRPLVEWGRLVGVGDPLGGAQAQHTVTVTVTNQTGSLPAGSQLLRSETGVIYQTTAAVALNAPTVTATIIATFDPDGSGGVGTIGNLEVGDIVEFANPLPNVGREAVVVTRTVDGADAETPHAYRLRVDRRFSAKPQGGAYADYRVWGEEVPGIVAIYPYTGDPGEVDVYVEATVASSGSADGIPTGAQLTAVSDAIQLDDGGTGLATRRQVNAAVNVLAISRTAFDIEVSGLDAPDIDVAETEIENGVDEFLRSREPFITGLTALPRADRIPATAVSSLVHEIVDALGGSITGVVVKEGANQIINRTLQAGEKAKLGTVSYL